MTVSAICDAKSIDFQGEYNQPIMVLDGNLEPIDAVKRNIIRGDYGVGVFMRYKNKRYQVQRYQGNNVIVVRGDAKPRTTYKKSTGHMSAACRGARY